MLSAMRRSLYALLVVAFGSIAVARADTAPGKKLVQLGWDIPSTDQLAEHWMKMEDSPFDGVIFRIEFRDSEKKGHSSESAWDGRPWKRQWLDSVRTDLREVRFKKLSHSFVRFNSTPGNLDWGDDAGWANLAEKLQFCAELMKESQMRGISLDFESYGAHQFRFDPKMGRTFAQTRDLARKRGGQVMTGMASGYPDMTVLALWLNSINFKAGRNDDPDAILATEGYGLLPAFIDGMLDTLPPGMTLVDGCENGYYMDGELAYQRAANDMRGWNGPAVRMVSPENRAKYRRQVQAGFGFYLDMYLNEPGNRYYFGPKDGGTRLDRLRDNLAGALAASDQYVWVYGEQCRWWETPWGGWKERVEKMPGKGRLWEEAMPGLTVAMEEARDPLAHAMKQVERQAGKNLLKNGHFTAVKNGQPADWGAWQDEKSPTGKFAHDADGAAQASGVTWGCFMQSISVKPGEKYVAIARGRTRGGVISLMVRWQREDNAWTKWEEDQTFTFTGTERWKTARGVVTVPTGAGKLVVLLNVNQQLSKDDTAWFDDVEVYRVK